MHVNLLPSSFVWRRLISKRLRQWGLAFALLGVASLLCNALLLDKWWHGLSELQEARAAADPIRQLQRERIQQSKDTLVLEQKIIQLQSAVAQDRTNSLLGIVANGVRSSDGSVQIQELQVLVVAKPWVPASLKSESQLVPGPKLNSSSESNSMRSERQLTLRGIAIESESISTFMKSLQESNVFSKVELRSSQERLVSNRSVQEFQMECHSHD